MLSGREARPHLIRGEAQRPQGAVVGVHRLQQGSRRQLEDLQLSALTRNKKAQCVWDGMHPYGNKRGIKKWPKSSALALERLSVPPNIFFFSIMLYFYYDMPRDCQVNNSGAFPF